MIKTALFLATTLTASIAMAGNYATYTDYAEITDVEKIYKNRTISKPYQDCYIKEFTTREPIYSENSGSLATNQLLGGILGGVIGNQFGGGNGKKAMTVAGALLGSSMARDSYGSAQAYETKTHQKEVCETRYERNTENYLSHYKITYELNGHGFSYTTTRLPNDQEKLEVSVSVKPK
jgi:uncharacterized protein YcfJ